ncbi:F-box domain containing protein [Pandoravirus dulcis]|uniref:F-box domain containing protein n=1 Tax=Pandoravirus dulcis TaxID=1349409 RepID=S4VTK3_9VIRU|nr:F-box domain containing protein [Pandoravirus dulcis]AGO82755.1 F-box domain containing protein [Pandoravirus dulcis]
MQARRGNGGREGEGQRAPSRHDEPMVPPANDDLPNEMLALAFGWLHCMDRRVRAAAVCRTWRLVALDDGAVGRRLCARKAPRWPRTPAFCAAKAAVKAAHGDCARRIFAAHPKIDDPHCEIPKAAARSDDVAHFVWVAGRCRVDKHAVAVEAASYGASRTLAHIIGDPWIISYDLIKPMKKAIKRDRVECVAVLARRCRGRCEPMVEAAARGTTAVVDLLLAAGHGLHTGLCATAASWGRLDMLCHLRSVGCPWDALTCAWAIEIGRPDILAYARDHGCPWDARSCAMAAATGQHQLLTQLRDAGCDWDVTATRAAAKRGDIESLMYLHRGGCPMDAAVCEHAVAGGHLAVLTYAHEHGCPWNERTINAAGFALCRALDRRAPRSARTEAHQPDARDAGRIACIAYAREHGCPSDGRVVERAIRVGDLAGLARAHGAGCGWSAQTTALAAASGRNAMVVYAHESGCPWAAWTVPAAAARGALNLLRYALTHDCPYDETEALEAARKGGQWPCAALLLWAALPGAALDNDA